MVKSTYKQTFIGIWFHDNNLPSYQQEKMQLVLNQTFDYYRIFTSEQEFYTYIDEKRLVAKIFLIISISDSSLDSIVELAEQWPQIFEKVYTFSPSKTLTSTCFNTNNMDYLFEQINTDAQDYICKTNSSDHTTNEIFEESRLPPSFSVFNSKLKKNTPIRHVTKESLNFLCFLTMTDILRRISSYNPEELLDMWTSFRELYKGNQPQLDYIDTLERTYAAREAIRYYTGNSCLSRTINKACHTEDMQQLFTYRVYISDLHKQLDVLDKEQENDDVKSFIENLYRGKPVSCSVLQQLIDNEGGLISMNGFLSTTAAPNVALQFAGEVKQISAGQKSILFMLEIEKPIKQPYAYIGSCSTKRDELEVLFSLGTVWRIKSINLKEDPDPCIIELTSCDELDSTVSELLKKYTENECNLSSVGDILYKLGNNDEAEWFYNKMLKQDSLDDITCGILLYKIGRIRFEKKDFTIALHKFKEAAKLLPPSTTASDNIRAPRPIYVCVDESPLIAIYNNMGLIYKEDCQFEKSVECYKKALEVKDGLPTELAIVHNNLGLLYYSRGKYTEAQQHHTEAFRLVDESDSKRKEFKENLDSADQRCRHVYNKNQHCPVQTTINKLIQ